MLLLRKTVIVVSCVLLAGGCWTACKRSPAAQEAKFLARGKKLLDAKDYSRAALEFNNAAKLNPNRAETWYDLATALLASGRVRDGAIALRRTLALQPNHTGAQIRLSELMVQSRDPEMLQDAVKRLDQVLATDQNQADALDLLALAELKLNQPDEAVKHLEQSLDKFPGRLRSSAALAGVQFWRGDFQAAESTLRKAADAAPESVPAALALAQLYALEKKPTQAEAEIRRALRIDANSSAAWMALGQLQAGAGKMDEAEQTYRKIASLPKANLEYAHAAFLLQTGKQDQALAEFRQLSAAAPGNREARLRLISAQVRTGKTDEALGVLGEMLKKNPKDTEALLLRSQVRLYTGRPAEAVTDLQAVLHYNAQSPDAHYGLARAYGALGRQRMRESELGEVVRLRADLLAARLDLARAQIGGGHPETALQTVEGAPGRQGEDVATIEVRNWALLAMDRRSDAEAGVERGLHIRPTVNLVLQRGILKNLKQDYKGAAEDATIALRGAPNHTGAFNLLMEARVAQKQTGAALDALRAVRSRQPVSSPMLLLAGHWYRRLNQPNEARATYQQAKAVPGAGSAPDLALAALDASDGKKDEAKATLSGVVAREPENQTALLMLASLEYEAKDRVSALAHFRTVAELSPENVIALNGAAYLLATTDPDQALPLAERAYELASGDPTVQDTVGWVYYRKGLYQKAADVLQLSVAKDPTPVHQFHLAMSLIKSGDKGRGTELLNNALAKNPDLVKTEQGW